MEEFEIHHPFAPTKFNFTKINPNEILYVKKHRRDQDLGFLEEILKEKGEDFEVETHLLTNVSPIFHSHSLLCPLVNCQLPQFLGSQEILGQFLHFFFFEIAQKSHKNLSKGHNFCAGYNSVGANSSINHLHFQIISMISMKHAVGDDVTFYGEFLTNFAENYLQNKE